jgi:hypothetical protein
MLACVPRAAIFAPRALPGPIIMTYCCLSPRSLKLIIMVLYKPWLECTYRALVYKDVLAKRLKCPSMK